MTDTMLYDHSVDPTRLIFEPPAEHIRSALNAANDRRAHLEQIDTQIGWHHAIIAELRRDRASLNDEPPAYYDRFGDNLQTIASGIAGRK